VCGNSKLDSAVLRYSDDKLFTVRDLNGIDHIEGVSIIVN
jgi:hypothetical protein